MSIKIRKPLIIVFDLDECIGNWKLGGYLYLLFKSLKLTSDTKAKDIFIEYLLEASIRPGFLELLVWLRKLKEKNTIRKIILYTSNNCIGYPKFIVRCLEKATKSFGLFDKIYLTCVDKHHDRYGFKNLNILKRTFKYISAPFNNIIIFDDKKSVWDTISRKRVVMLPAYQTTNKIQYRNLCRDIRRKFNLKNKTIIHIKQDNLFYTSKPHISKHQLIDILKWLKQKKVTTKHSDLEVSQRIYPSIRHFIKDNTTYFFKNKLN